MADNFFVRLSRRSKKLLRANAWYIASAWRRRSMRPCIVFWPERPHPYTTAFQICKLLGIRVKTRLKSSQGVVFSWSDQTYRPYSLDDAFVKDHTVINLECRDISKETLDIAHEKVFGYKLNVNPMRHHGFAIRKTNENSKHNYETVECPVAHDGMSIYQMIVDNSDGNHVKDIRVVVVGSSIPLCYNKWRPIDDRFSNTNSRSEIVPVYEALSESEVKLVLDICKEIGLDFGELDVLRDNGSGLIYVVDANNTPLGPPNHLDQASYMPALIKIASSFQSEFLADTFTPVNLDI